MMLAFCQDTGLPCHVLLTKADKLSRNQAAQALTAMRRQFETEGLEATAQVFSSSEGTGVEAAREAVVALLRRERG
jgi:GTP-binding protein